MFCHNVALNLDILRSRISCQLYIERRPMESSIVCVHLFHPLNECICFFLQGCRLQAIEAALLFRAEHLALEHSMLLLLARGKGKMKTSGEARTSERISVRTWSLTIFAKQF